MRATRLGIAVLVLLVVLFAGYSAYWLIAAHRIEAGVARWAEAKRAEKIEASWQKLGVGGFPASLRIEFDRAALRDAAVSPAAELHIPMLIGSASPFDFADWRLDAPQGLSAALAGAHGRPRLELAADRARGAVAVTSGGGATVWLHLENASAGAGLRVRVAAAQTWLLLPPKPPQSDMDPLFGIAADLHRIELPRAVRALGDHIEELALGLTVKGPLQGGNLVKSIAAWRDAGGTVELDHLQLDWGGLAATATGTIALDQDLQPIGGFSGAIEGYDRVLRALVQDGRMRAEDAGLARLALAMLAKAGPDGQPQIATSFTIQNGQMFLGPARLGAAPRIAWE